MKATVATDTARATGIDPSSVTRSRPSCRRLSRTGRPAGRLFRQPLNRSYEPIASLRKSFDETRAYGRVSQRLTDFLDRRRESVFEIDKCVLGPEERPEFFATNDLPGPLDQSLEDLERLLLQTDPCAPFEKFTTCGVVLRGSISLHSPRDSRPNLRPGGQRGRPSPGFG